MAADTYVDCKKCGESIPKCPYAGGAKHYWCSDCKTYTIPSRGDEYDPYPYGRNEMTNPEQER